MYFRLTWILLVTLVRILFTVIGLKSIVLISLLLSLVIINNSSISIFSVTFLDIALFITILASFLDSSDA